MKKITTFAEKLPLILLLGLVGLVSFGTIAHAADAATAAAPSSPLDLLRPVYDAFAGGHYAYAAALGTIAALALVKRYAGSGKFGAWVHGTAGSAITTLLLAGAGAMAAGLAAPGAHVSLGLLKSALLVGIGAVGGVIVLTHLLVEPVLKPLSAKAPKWMQPLFALLFAFLDHSNPGAQALADAQAAGDAAVAAKPAAGIAAVTGSPTDVQ